MTGKVSQPDDDLAPTAEELAAAERGARRCEERMAVDARPKAYPKLTGPGGRLGLCASASCGKAFERPKGIKLYCSTRCGARERMRRQQKAGSGKSASERLAAQHRKHFKRCSRCKAGAACGTSEAMLVKHDALSAVVDVSPEAAQAIEHRGGRTPKRSTT